MPINREQIQSKAAASVVSIVTDRGPKSWSQLQAATAALLPQYPPKGSFGLAERDRIARMESRLALMDIYWGSLFRTAQPPAKQVWKAKERQAIVRETMALGQVIRAVLIWSYRHTKVWHDREQSPERLELERQNWIAGKETLVGEAWRDYVQCAAKITRPGTEVKRKQLEHFIAARRSQPLSETTKRLLRVIPA